ncbi:unnamed protein product [Arabis nemorensis]|uniref:CCHC-type domain-containing protein n=1 Tax=Arabis nemorensis TaxID=586526 RepID=A0A565AVD2_9BRAS|nr:unnamed protein product [Arabis nemorensis]
MLDSDELAKPKSPEDYQGLYNLWTQLSKAKIKLAQEIINFISLKEELELGHSQRSHSVKRTGRVSKLTKEDNVRMLHAELRKKKEDANIGKTCLAKKYKIVKMLSTCSNWLDTTEKEDNSVKNNDSGGTVRCIPVAPQRPLTRETFKVKWERNRIDKRIFNGCFYCGKSGHSWKKCFKRKKKIQQLWNLKKCWMEPTRAGY